MQDQPRHRSVISDLPARIGAWFDRIDPGTHRRIKGLRLVTAFGLAAMLATMPEISSSRPAMLGPLAAGFALWASVFEAETTRYASARALILLCLAAGVGAASFAVVAPRLGPEWAELMLVSGSFCVGFFRRFGVLGSGIGSMIFIGQLLAYSVGVTVADLKTVALAVALAALASVIPRTLSGPAEQPAVALAPLPPVDGNVIFSEISMGLQAVAASLAIIGLSRMFGLTESAWAITACTYVVANSLSGTIERVRRRIVGTLIGVPLALACLPVVAQAPLLIWIAAAIALVVYAMALPERYDIACGAYAFALIVTMAESGDYPFTTLLARGWETLVGGAIGLAIALLFAPLPNAIRRQP